MLIPKISGSTLADKRFPSKSKMAAKMATGSYRILNFFTIGHKITSKTTLYTEFDTGNLFLESVFGLE